jgi:hypothetical protein
VPWEITKHNFQTLQTGGPPVHGRPDKALGAGHLHIISYLSGRSLGATHLHAGMTLTQNPSGMMGNSEGIPGIILDLKLTVWHRSRWTGDASGYELAKFGSRFFFIKNKMCASGNMTVLEYA